MLRKLLTQCVNTCKEIGNVIAWKNIKSCFIAVIPSKAFDTLQYKSQIYSWVYVAHCMFRIWIQQGYIVNIAENMKFYSSEVKWNLFWKTVCNLAHCNSDCNSKVIGIFKLFCRKLGSFKEDATNVIQARCSFLVHTSLKVKIIAAPNFILQLLCYFIPN